MNIIKNKIFWGIVLAIVVAGGALFTYEVRYLAAAHSTFENYYAFRGCQTLIDRTDAYGDCKTASGETIRIVKYDNRWFLDGDLPVCAFYIGSFCPFNWP